MSVWVIADQRNGALRKPAFEALSEGRRLAGELGTNMEAVIVGHNVEGLCNEIASYGAEKLYLIDHESFLNEFMENTGRWDKKFTCVFCKRTMYRISEAISEKYGYKALVTGENLGQVASQTLKNLYVLEQSVKIPVLRPLLCMDKQETIDIAKKIGTYEISIKKSIKCKYVP